MTSRASVSIVISRTSPWLGKHPCRALRQRQSSGIIIPSMPCRGVYVHQYYRCLESIRRRSWRFRQERGIGRSDKSRGTHSDRRSPRREPASSCLAGNRPNWATRNIFPSSCLAAQQGAAAATVLCCLRHLTNLYMLFAILDGVLDRCPLISHASPHDPHSTFLNPLRKN